MAYETLIDEPVKVWAFFDPSASSEQVGIFPIAIAWRRRLIKLQKVIFEGTRKIGEAKLISLVCAGENANFELEYNASDYSWRLKKVLEKE